ncbi:hypothetical protein F7725_028101 [Dissostichus mawsoni]|uniref:Uncharacterized protein n=1 Tax=Dissostichus mawsoni TaxID=36200 RepID=A0A7J5XFA9_DISMA|nr:hypothetical protein F7725_028101 [Dissostichus mawsoni]
MKDICEELGCPEDKVQQWVNDVRDWATNDSNKIRQLRRKRLREEKTKLLAAIRQYNTGQPPEGEIQKKRWREDCLQNSKQQTV